MKTAKVKLNRLLVITFGAALLGTTLRAADQTTEQTNIDVQTLEQQIQTLNQEVQALKHQQQEDRNETKEAVKNSPHLTVGADGINFSSPNSNFVAGLHAVVQVDSRTFFQNGATPGIDGFLLRRARIILQGTVYHNFDYYFQPEFAGNTPQILDAYLNYRAAPELQLEAGKFKPPVGLEALASDTYLFFNERSLASDLAPYRDIGAELHGDVFGGAFSYAAGIFNGLPDLNTSTINTNLDDDMAFAGRFFTSPFKNTSISPLKGLGFGVSGSYEHDQATSAGLTPGYTTDGQEKFFTYNSGVVAHGAHWRVSPQGYYYWGPLGVMAEYIVSDQEVAKTAAAGAPTADLRNTAWEVSGGWVLTGENDTYNGVVPRHPFNPLAGDWGAWQIVGRFAQLDVDDAAFTGSNFATASTSAHSARAWSAGLNWYLNKDLRANVSFSRTWFTGGASGNPITKQPENVLFTRMQLAF
jgi:phosphate-selective porin OprO/OprP